MKTFKNGSSWHSMSFVRLERTAGAKSREEDPSMSTWKVAVLRVSTDRAFRVGFIPDFSVAVPVPVMRDKPITASEYGMRVGPEDVTFVACTESGEPVGLTLVELVDADDPRYANLLLV